MQPMLIAPVHVVELVNIPPELRLESRAGSRHSGRSDARPDSYDSYVGYKNRDKRRAGGFTVVGQRHLAAGNVCLSPGMDCGCMYQSF